MSGQEKTLKIATAIDTASFEKARNAVSALTREVEKLVAAVSKVNFGGGGGGGMGARLSTNSTPASGGSSSVAQMSSRFGTGMSGGVADNLTKAVTQSSQLFRVAADGSKNSFKVMQDALSGMVRSSDREIKTLTANLQKLEQTYGRLKERQASGRGGDLTEAMIGKVGGMRAAGMDAVSAAHEYKAQVRQEQQKYDDSRNAATSLRQRLYGGGGGAPPPQIPVNQGKDGGGLRGLRTALGAAGLGMLAGGGMLAAGIGLTNFGLSAAYENKGANLQYGMGLQSQTLNRQATYGQIYGGNATALYHGDIALSHAMRMAAKDKEYARATATVSQEAQKQLIQLQNPTGLGGSILKGGLSGIGTAAKSAAGNGPAQAAGNFISDFVAKGWAAKAYEGVRGFFKGNAGGGGGGTSGGGLGEDFAGRTTLEISQANEMNKMPEQIAQQRQDALMKVMQRNPLLNTQMQDYVSGAMGDLGLARMARVAGGLVKDPKTGLYTGDGVANFKARSIAAGWDPGQAAAMQQSIGVQVGWQAKGVGAQAMLSKQMGGFGSALNVAAMGAQFGNNGGALVNSIAGRGGMVGRGGLDISAGSQIAGMGASMMQSGNFAGSGLGLMQTLGAAGYTGSSGGDMRQARMMEAGVGAMGNVMSGNIDPLQKGLNASAAMKAAPNAPYATHAALMNMDPGTMLAAIKSKNVPPELAAMGVSLPILQKYMAAQNGTAFARYSESMGAGTEAGAAISRYQKAGGNMSYMKSWTLKRKQDELSTLGVGMRLAGGAASNEAGISRMRIQAAEEGILKTPKGRGAFAVGAGNVRKAALQSDAERAKMAGTSMADLENAGGEFTKSIQNINPAMAASERERQASQAHASNSQGAGGVDGAIASINAAFNNFVSALRGDPQIAGSRMGSAKKAGAPSASK